MDRSGPRDAGLTRRRLLRSAVGALALAAAPRSGGLHATTVGPASQARTTGPYPFRLGVASGEPSADGCVLWTRLAPEPLDPLRAGMSPEPVAVDWRVAGDPLLSAVVRHGTARATRGSAHSVHVDVSGLQPGRDYWFQFRAGGHLSPIGRMRTLPMPGAPAAGLAFAFTSCQRWDAGFYGAYRDLVAHDLDFVVHLGDYVYEDGIPSGGGVRRRPVPPELRGTARTLERWRLQYALYKTDADLQRAHAALPWIVTWDDHEVANNYAAASTPERADIRRRRAAAYQAFYEHHPVRSAARRRDGTLRLHRSFVVGDLAHLHVLDGRQYRTVPACGWGAASRCDGQYDPAASLLGARQERWLHDGLAASQARWNVLGNNVLLARMDLDGRGGTRVGSDCWDGYPAARQRLLSALEAAAVRNPVVLTGDCHATYVNDIHRDFDRPGSPVVATEIVGTSLTSKGLPDVYEPLMRHNPHIRFNDHRSHGYVLCRVGRSTMTADLRMIDDVRRTDSAVTTLATFAVEDGRPGAQQA